MNDSDEKYDEMTLYASQNQQDQRAIFNAREDNMKKFLNISGKNQPLEASEITKLKITSQNFISHPAMPC